MKCANVYILCKCTWWAYVIWLTGYAASGRSMNGEQRRRGIWVSSCLFLYSLNLLQWELIEEELTADKKKKKKRWNKPAWTYYWGAGGIYYFHKWGLENDLILKMLFPVIKPWQSDKTNYLFSISAPNPMFF